MILRTKFLAAVPDQASEDLTGSLTLIPGNRRTKCVALLATRQLRMGLSGGPVEANFNSDHVNVRAGRDGHWVGVDGA
ncbi:MAG: hypothetical protein OXN89_25210, partial [Bryobacterales bacterium]|nr:hypothetical protein [Bryobacterales bacterium]